MGPSERQTYPESESLSRQELQQALSRREKQIQELAAASIQAGEKERQWIAAEVHDRVAQNLASVFQQLQALESLTRSDPRAYQTAVRASLLVRETIREARNIMNDLHPPALDEFGLVLLVQEELRRFQEDTGCYTKLNDDYSVKPCQEVEVALYRIFHEALTNIKRHAASARNTVVALASGEGAISLRVEDDGPGFNVEVATRKGQVGGLLGMRWRAEILGGTLQVTSIPGKGTRVTVAIPMNANEKGGYGSE